MWPLELKFSAGRCCESQFKCSVISTNNPGNVQSILSVTEHVTNMKDEHTLLNCKPFNIIKADSLNFCKNKWNRVYLYQNQSNRNNLFLGRWIKTQRKVCETKKKRGRDKEFNPQSFWDQVLSNHCPSFHGANSTIWKKWIIVPTISVICKIWRKSKNWKKTSKCGT